MEGDSVTLKLDLSKIQVLSLIRWRFGDKGSTIAQTDGNEFSYSSDEIFRDRLQLDQKASLTITNIRTNHSGLYEAEINHNTGTLYNKFSVSVHGNELIVWWFGDEGKLIAKHDMEAKTIMLHNTDKRFRDRLKLDRQTGSLIITNSRTTDSGPYSVKISSNKQTSYKRFTVTVSDTPGVPNHVPGDLPSCRV
ncbi:Hepatocyte cell adhesion molecule [Labeo rohita]|uniref:Hepatocyte cell adhesion molecule n=1 Tax=Labeo rohita TaxID=84645 RepID=A0ABQ8LAI2_LABRO|nr:Hepatocyte cell adhesion molecule [Labeo rohita]